MSNGSGADTQVLIVEDDETIRMALGVALRQQGYAVTAVSTAEDGLTECQRERFDIAISDVKLPGLSGLDFVARAHGLNPEIIVIMMSGGGRSVATEAVARGAYDFFVKPFRVPELEIVMRRALEKRQLQREVRGLRQQLEERSDPHGLIGESSRIREVRALVHKVARN